ncbi:MAG TPA: hypothetical protein VJA21_17455, partial [Verrucomicrobiae bacterium]
MKTLAATLCALLLASSAFSGSETIIRERAKELRNQNNVRQGVAPPTTAQPAISANPAYTPPAQSPALLKLKSDIAAITANAQVSAVQKEKIARDVIAVAQGAKPSLATASRFAENVSAAQSEKPLSATSLARLIQEVDAVLNPAKYPQAKPDGIFADVQAIFQENGLKRTRAVEISNSVKSLAAEVKA